MGFRIGSELLRSELQCPAALKCMPGGGRLRKISDCLRSACTSVSPLEHRNTKPQWMCLTLAVKRLLLVLWCWERNPEPLHMLRRPGTVEYEVTLAKA